jgi:hypothetical protein
VVAPTETVAFTLETEPGTKTRYRVTTETSLVPQGVETAVGDEAATSSSLPASEFSEVVFTQEILGPVPGDPNTAVALVIIDDVAYRRTSGGRPDLTFDSRNAMDPNRPFARLIGQAYTIEITALGYVPAVFNLRPVRAVVRGETPAHAAALELVSPPAIFARHGFFSLPGPDVGPLTVGGRWRGVQQFTIDVPGRQPGQRVTHRFEKIYRLERVEARPVGAVAVVAFTGAPIPKTRLDSRAAGVPLPACSYAGGGEFNLDAGRVERYGENLELRLPPPAAGALPVEGSQGPVMVVTRFCRVQRLDVD